MNPDIDTLGSTLAVHWVFCEHFPHIHADLICVSEIPESAQILEGSHLYKNHFDPDEYDLIMFFDSGSKNQTGFDTLYPKLYDATTYNTISIDHHATNELYARQNILNITYASTTMILFEIFYFMGIPLSPHVASCLLAGIYTDTGAFQHSNTSSLAYKMASYLVQKWAKKEEIVEHFFKKNSLKKMKLWGKIMKESFIDNENVLNAYVNKTLLESVGCDYEDIAWVIDVLNTVEGVSYTSLLTQKGEYIRASLRTLRDDVDVSLIAKEFSGWGHKKASGFTTKWVAFWQPEIKIIDSV